MDIKNGDCLHVVLYGTFMESKYFLDEYKEYFDLIGFNAHIIAHAPGAITGFISQLLNKTYFIDPQTHAFQHDPRTVKRKKDNKEWVVKESIKKLSKHYGSIFEKHIGVSSLTADMLMKANIEEICTNILNFQSNIIAEEIKNTDLEEFLRYADIELKPDFLIAPYLYIEAEV